MEKGNTRPTDHLANERTYLAWVRTGIAIMAFGFVVVKFTLFIKQVSIFINLEQKVISLPATRYSAIIGILLVGLGTLMILLAFFRYKDIEKQLKENSYFPSLTLSVFLTIALLLVGVLLMIYLLPNV